MPDVTTALSSVAMASASLAEQAADRAECLVRLRGYTNDTATVLAARAYASCVYTVYGSGRVLSFAELFFLKTVVLLTAVGVVIGGWTVWREDRELPMVMAGSMIGAFAGALLAATFAGFWFGLGFLLS